MTKHVVIDILREYFCKAIPLNRAIYTTYGVGEQYPRILFQYHLYFQYYFSYIIYFYLKNIMYY